LETSESTEIKLKMLNAKLITQMTKLDEAAKKFERKNEQVLLNIFPKGSNGISPVVHHSETTQVLLDEGRVNSTRTPAATANTVPQQQRTNTFAKENNLPPVPVQPTTPPQLTPSLNIIRDNK
jgi:hypothetical protein